MYWIAFGDIHESIGTIAMIPDLADAEGVIITGDLTNRGTREAANHVITTVAEINPTIYAQPGNMDTDSVQAYLKDRDFDIHLNVREIAPGIGLMGVGLSTVTPFGTPGEVSEGTLVKWLNETYLKARSFSKLIVAVHEPPYDTLVDQLDNGQHVGSPGVRAFIERVQPDIVLTGHIHESRNSDMVGQTPVLNPGMLAGGGYVRIDFVDNTLTAKIMSI